MLCYDVVKRLRASDRCFVVVLDLGAKRITTVYDVVRLSELRLEGSFGEKRRPRIVKKQKKNIQGREIKNQKSTGVRVNVVVHVHSDRI